MSQAPSQNSLWLRWMLRPPGSGIHTVSTGDQRANQMQTQHFKAVLGSSSKSITSGEEALKVWEKSLKQLSVLNRAKVAILGVPLDTGAGIRRGAAGGPLGVRESLLKLGAYRKLLQSGMVVDLGDVFVNPHLLHDEMLNAEQIKLCQDAMYAEVPEPLRRGLPVSALSQVRWILQRLHVHAPNLRVFVIGGDHSVAWPVVEAFSERYADTLGIVQPDAHTDLLESRLGVRYCFGTWSYHAREKIGDPGRLVQLGIRQSRRDRKHWESELGVRQLWASEIFDQMKKAKGASKTKQVVQQVTTEIAEHLKKRNVEHIYFSNDIDGTDEREASATGTPAPQGLSRDFLIGVIEGLGREFAMVAADIMEVAPDLGPTPAARKRTCDLAARYTLACLTAMTKR